MAGSGEAGVEAMGEEGSGEESKEEESEEMIDASEEVSDPSMEAVASEPREEVGVVCTVVEWTESLVWGSP